MNYSFSDSKVFTEKDKKYFTTNSGAKLDLTWRPAIIDKLYKEYITVLLNVQNEIPKQMEAIARTRKQNFASPEDIEYIKLFADLVESYKNKCNQIIIASMKANGVEINSDWIDDNLITEEKDLLIQVIMDTFVDNFDTKKK